MDFSYVLIVLGAFAVASFLKGLTGMGFSTMCLGILAGFIDVKNAVPLVILPAFVCSALVIVDSGKMRDAFRTFWPLFLCTVCGLLCGLAVLGAVHNSVARTVLGAVMAVYAFWSLWKGSMTIPMRLMRPLFLPVGLSTGFINGLTGSQIMPVLPYLMALEIDADLLVAAINISFSISCLIMIAGLSKMHLMTGNVLIMAALGIPVTAFGIKYGGKLRRRVSEEWFRKMVLVLLIGLGVNLMIQG